MTQSLYEAATDSICSMLIVCEDVQAYYPLATILKAQVETLRDQFQAAVQTEDSDRWVWPATEVKPFL